MVSLKAMAEQETLQDSFFAEVQADELLRLDDYDVDDTVDEEVIIQGKVTTEDSVLYQESFFVREKAIEELGLDLMVDKEASGSSEECLQLNDDKVFNVANVKETVDENVLSESKPFQAASGSDAPESAHAEVNLSGVDSKPTKCLEEKLKGSCSIYRELKQDLVVILNCYKEQINAAHDHLQDCWGDTYVKVLSNIRWFKNELHKLRHRHIVLVGLVKML
jgi:hypothetical protein